MNKIILNTQRKSALVRGEPGRCRFPDEDGACCATPTDVLYIGGQRTDGRPRTRWHICRDHAAPLVGLLPRR